MAGMRLPQAWNDRELLQDEPFCSEFVVRALAPQSRKRNGGVDWGKRIGNAIRAATNGVRFITILKPVQPFHVYFISLDLHKLGLTLRSLQARRKVPSSETGGFTSIRRRWRFSLRFSGLFTKGKRRRHSFF